MCVAIVAYKMTSTNTSGLSGRVGEFDVARETFSAYFERMEMFLQPTTLWRQQGREVQPPTKW